jgi:hypothetical protein
MHEKQLEKIVPNPTKGIVLTSAIKTPIKAGGLILPGVSEYSEIQKVVKTGPYVMQYNADKVAVGFGPGDWVKINMKRFIKPKEAKSLKDGNEYNSTHIEYYVPVVVFGGNEYFEIDQGDIEYWWPESSIKN